jgi:hypothetical protein
MTLSDAAREPRPNIEPTEFEGLLPWYAVGTLRRRDRQRVEDALAKDQNLGRQDLARQVDLVREELTETIHLNETLGAPPRRVLDRLMASIDAEADAARKRTPGAAAGWLTGFFANLSPRTMAVAASFATLAIALQAFMLVDIFTRPEGTVSGYGLTPAHNGTFAMVRFARQASAAEITNFLQNYQATLVDGPTPSGLYRVRVAMSALAKEEVGRIIARMRQDHIVESAEPSE